MAQKGFRLLLPPLLRFLLLLLLARLNSLLPVPSFGHLCRRRIARSAALRTAPGLPLGPNPLHPRLPGARQGRPCPLLAGSVRLVRPISLFATSDDFLRSCPSYCILRLLREQLVHGHCLTVTSSTAPLHTGSTTNSFDIKIFIDCIEVTCPDLFNDGRFVIHGIGGFVAPLSPLSCSPGNPTFAPDTTAAAHDSDRPGSAVSRLMLRDAIVRLRDGGFRILALAMRVKNAELAALQNMTVFALDDPSIFSGGHAYVTEVRFHVIPNRFFGCSITSRTPTWPTTSSPPCPTTTPWRPPRPFSRSWESIIS